MNIKGIIAIYKFEMSRTFRTFGQSIASPVLSTALYFIVFGSAIGSRIEDIDGVSYSVSRRKLTKQILPVFRFRSIILFTRFETNRAISKLIIESIIT